MACSNLAVSLGLHGFVERCLLPIVIILLVEGVLPRKIDVAEALGDPPCLVAQLVLRPVDSVSDLRGHLH